MPKGITWGFFEGGFNLSTVNANGTTGCKRSTTSTVTNTNKADYIPHHSRSSITQSRPIRPMRGHHRLRRSDYTDAANHQYDIHDFFTRCQRGQFSGGQYS